MKCISIPYKVSYLLAAFLLFTFFIDSVYASTASEKKYIWNNQQYSSGSAACAAAGTNLTYISTSTRTGAGGPFNVASSFWLYYYVGADIGDCKNTSNQVVTSINQGEVCPISGQYVLSNGHMYCGTGDPEPVCPAAGTKKTSPLALGGLSGQQGISANMCAGTSGGDCGIKCSSGIASYNDVSGQSSVYCDTYEFTGAACTNTSLVASSVSSVPTANQATPVNTPPKSKADCPGGSGFAEVNNVGMCLPSGTQYSSGNSTTSSSTGSVTSTSTTTINNNGTATTTTINTYKDAAGNITYSGTGTQTGSTNLADGTGINGQKGTNPTDLGTAPTFDNTLPGEGAFTPKVQSNPIISTTIFNSSSSCPAPIEFSAMNQAFTISFQPICDLSDIIRGIVLLLSGIVAMRAVVSN